MIDVAGETCYNATQFLQLKDQIFVSHMVWGTVCFVLGSAIVYFFWWMSKRQHGESVE